MKDLKDYDNVLRIRCQNKKVACELAPIFTRILIDFEQLHEENEVAYKQNLVMLRYHAKNMFEEYYTFEKKGDNDD